MRTRSMTPSFHHRPHSAASEAAALEALAAALGGAGTEPEVDPRAVQAVGDALDAMRRACARASAMALRAQVFGVSTEVVCAVLNEVTDTANRAVDHWLSD